MFTRIHTAALSIPLTVLGGIIAGVPVVSWQTLEFAILGLLFHALGFAQNNLADIGYDAEDPAKQHHPLVRGKINFRRANWMVNFGMMVLFFYGAMISNFNPWSLFFLGLMIISGNVYNYASKDTVWSFIPITLCFSSLPMIAYFAYASELSYLMLLVYVYIALQLIFQIAIEGCMKELRQVEEENLMRSLGYRVEGLLYLTLKTGWKGILFGYSNKAAAIVVTAMIVTSLTGDLLPVVLIGLIAGIMGLKVSDLLLKELWNRQRVVRDSALIEILSYMMLIVALSGFLGWTLVGAFIILPVLWFMLLNKIFWNTLIMPKV